MNSKELTEKEMLKLQRIYINNITYWEDMWKYKGTITFINEKKDEFTFNIGDEEIKEFIKIISKQVSKTAESFTEKLKKLFYL